MFLIPITRAACRLVLHAWANWCIRLLVVVVTTVGTQDIDSPPVTETLPVQVRKGMEMSHDAYTVAAFDCDEPEDVLTQSSPHEPNLSPRQEYTVLQKVASFEYRATLCTVQQSRNYYDCL